MSSKSGLLLTIFSPLFMLIVGMDLYIDNSGLKWWHILVMIFCFGISIVGLWNVKNDNR